MRRRFRAPDRAVFFRACCLQSETKAGHELRGADKFGGSLGARRSDLPCMQPKLLAVDGRGPDQMFHVVQTKNCQ